jgi:hypothetical protein
VRSEPVAISPWEAPLAIKHHQEIVVQYLCADPSVFVSEEYLVEWGAGKGQSIWVDAVAVDLREHAVYLVEITSDPNARAIIKKLNHDYAEMLPTIRRAMLGGLGLPDTWGIRPWLFLRERAAAKVIASIPRAVVPKITFLHTTAWEWEYGKLRRTGAEPGKPYPSIPRQYQ